MKTSKQRFRKRRMRVRSALRQKSGDQHRLSVCRSGRHIYAQIIDDKKGHTVTSASSLDKDVREKLKTGADKTAALEVGKLVASRAKKAGIEKVYFDRGGYIFHGRIKALADAARESGLSF